MKTLKFLGFVGVIFFQSCITTVPTPSIICGDKAKTEVSPNYLYSRNQRIVIMPFQATGKDRPESELGITDKFTVRLMGLGLYTIIDKGMVESFYYEHGIAENATLNKKQLELIKKELDVDLIFYGTVSYSYAPSQSYGSTYYGGKHSESSSRGGYYYLDSESLKVVSTTTGEVVITSYVRQSTCGGLSDEMAFSIKNKVVHAY